MNFIYAVILSTGLALCLFGTISKVGATQATLSKKKIFGITTVYALFQILMVGIGILIAYMVEKVFSLDSISKVTRIFAIALLVIIIYRILREVFCGKIFLEKRAEELNNTSSILLSLKSSFEAIVVGICVFELNKDTVVDLILVIILTISASLLGFWYGYFCGTKGNRAVMTCSAVFLTVSAVLLL